MVDLIRMQVSGGNGGDGRISFLSNRRTIKGGPDGGDGGSGGSVIARGTSHENTLRNFAGIARLAGENGYKGGAEKSSGKNREDLTVLLPVGTRVWRAIEGYTPNVPKKMYRIDRELGRVERAIQRRASSTIRLQDGVFSLTGDVVPEDIDTNLQKPRELPGMRKILRYAGQDIQVELLGDLTQDGQELLIARGGRGGRGNETFKSSRNTTPLEAQTGEGGESGIYFFELLLLADVGLVGHPNAGKSTLLSVLTKATPKIANYPFTTLEPNLGVLYLPGKAGEARSLVIADIPGLIEGASEGKGLGHAFLKHISRCKVLVFLLAGDDYIGEYKVLEKELDAYSDLLKEKQRVIVLSKADMLPSEDKEKILKEVRKKLGDVFWISSATGEGMEELRQAIANRK